MSEEDEACLDCGAEPEEGHLEGCGTTMYTNLAFQDGALIPPPVSMMMDTGPTSHQRRAPTRPRIDGEPEAPVTFTMPRVRSEPATAEEREARLIALEFAHFEPTGERFEGEHIRKVLV